MTQPSADVAPYEYVSYIGADIGTVWNTLLSPEQTATFWGHRNESTWEPGAQWRHVSLDGEDRTDAMGTVLEAAGPHRLKFTFEDPATYPLESASVATFTLAHGEGMTRLTLLHENFADQQERDLSAQGWAAVLSNLKTLLETGSPLPTDPWLMPADEV